MPNPRQAVVSERTFYPALLKIISEKGGSGVSEITFNSVPDIKFELSGSDWLLSVKVGETAAIIKDAFIQYLRHKEESGIQYGLLVMLPESVRKTGATEAEVDAVIRTQIATVLVDGGPVKDQYKDRPFPQILDILKVEVAPLIKKGVVKHYPLNLVINLLRVQVLEVMDRFKLSEDDILEIVTDEKLLTQLGRLSKEQAEDAARFLAAYIILSQILFLRLFAVVHPNIIVGKGRMTTLRLRAAFAKVLEINYKPIYKIDVLDLVNDAYLADTFDLIWGLAVERVRYELPGRLFHELMPSHIRKILAAFYTRPQAAELLARLTIGSSETSVFDLASGSGTILVAAYRQKRKLHDEEGRPGNPHKRFCEQEIFGADIMPFAVHLSSANLAAMDVPTTIHRTQIIQGDSIHLVPGKVYRDSLQLALFVEAKTVKTTGGEEEFITLGPVDAVLMNPPFTKVERGIRRYVDMEKFKNVAGGEVGLWGHYIFLANEFLRDGGIYGAVIPINVLRGRESIKVRNFLLSQWTPLYILKPVYNYGFSEWAEYRDILFIAQKKKPEPNHKVKFCLVKQDLTTLESDDIERIVENLKREDVLRTDLLDIDSHKLSEIVPRAINLMWFCGVTNLSHRDTIINFIKKFKGKLSGFPEQYFREGYRPVPKGVSDFMFLTRSTNPVRVREAFLHFAREGAEEIEARTELGVSYQVERDKLTPSLRTPVGLTQMDISRTFDYVANGEYDKLRRVQRACGFKGGLPKGFWHNVESQLAEVSSNVVVTRRINPYSPNAHLTAFVSAVPISSSNQMNIILERDIRVAKAVAAVLNSSLFFAYFFLLKEESTGRYIDIRFYDLYQMALYPEKQLIQPLEQVFRKYAHKDFPSLRHQFDRNFDIRYSEFWKERTVSQPQITMWPILDKPVEPAEIRLEYDNDICEALGVKMSKKELLGLYEVIIKEMIITRHLTKD